MEEQLQALTAIVEVLKEKFEKQQSTITKLKNKLRKYTDLAEDNEQAIEELNNQMKVFDNIKEKVNEMKETLEEHQEELVDLDGRIGEFE